MLLDEVVVDPRAELLLSFLTHQLILNLTRHLGELV